MSILDEIKDAIEADLLELRDSTEENAREYARFAAETLEKIGQAGATPEMIRTGKDLMALRLANITRETEKQLYANFVEGWFIAARILYRIAGP